MKQFQRATALLLALLLMMAVISASAFAETNYKVATLKKNTWYKLPYEGDANTIYKFALTKDSIVTVNWKNSESGDPWVGFYTDKKCNDRIYNIYIEKTTGSDVFALSKGTYYIRMYDWPENPTTRVKFSVQKAVNQNNYCRAKAVVLKSNTTVKIAQTADYNYPRWYKISLSKKKTVTITTNDDMAGKITLFNSKMQEINCAVGSRTVITEDPVPKGTYFIRVSDTYYYNAEYVGACITMKWK